MSFFNDFLKELNVYDIKNYLSFSIIMDKGFCISGNFKVEYLSNDKIIISTSKNKIDINGDSISVVYMAKGEICLSGGILDFQVSNGKTKH